jgi:metal-dependent hydrolase (beta-lactamase superfamily II)
MRIVSLVDNISEEAILEAKHGLSFYIETTNHKILCDLVQARFF